MFGAMISRVRMHALAVWAAHDAPGPPNGVPLATHAAWSQPVVDAISIDNDLPPRPRVASPRPGTDDLMAPNICVAP